MSLSDRSKAAVLSLGFVISGGLWSISTLRQDFNKLPPVQQELIKKDHDKLASRFKEVGNYLSKGDFDVANREYAAIGIVLDKLDESGFKNFEQSKKEYEALGNCLKSLKKVNESFENCEGEAGAYSHLKLEVGLRHYISMHGVFLMEIAHSIELQRSGLLSAQQFEALSNFNKSRLLDDSATHVKIMKTLADGTHFPDAAPFIEQDKKSFAKEMQGIMQSTQYYLRILSHK